MGRGFFSSVDVLWRKGPWGNVPPPRPTPPDFDAMFRRGQERFRDFMPESGSPKLFGLIALGVLAFWLLTGFYIVKPEEQAVVTRFGAFTRTELPGLHYHIPFPIEQVQKVPVTTTNRTEVGIRSGGEGGRRNREANLNVLEESLMLTSDENIVDIDFEIQWRIADAAKFLFNVRDPEFTLRSVAESAMREVVSKRQINQVLVEQTDTMGDEARDIIQEVLNRYDMGIEVIRLQMGEVQPPAAVIDAFRDVITAAQDKDRMRNEATRYKNEIENKAEGESQQLINEALAYKEQVIARAKGEASRFLAVYEEYAKAKQVTRDRMLLETMEQILTDMDKLVVGDDATKSGIVPYLPLQGLDKKAEKQ